MAENLDDETIRNLNETLRELNDQMDGLNRLLPSMVASLDKTGDGFKDQEQMMKKLGMTQEEYNKAIDQGIDLKEAERKADEQIARTKANLNAALANGVASLGSFKNALLNAEAGLAKYSDSLDKLGDGAIDLGKNFGLAGVAVGLLTKAVTSVAGASLKQAEAALKARDELVKIGNAGGITAKQTLEMGYAAGLTSKNLNLLTKPMVKAGEALAMIGGSATQGTETFKKLVDVGEDTRIKYRRLGLGVGELIEFQADYLNLQKASGAQLSSEEKTQAKLQANSLKYIDNLMALSNLTGKSVDQLKKEQDQAMATYRVQLYNLEFNKKIRDAEKAGDTALRDRLVAERNARNQFLQFVESNLGPTAKAQAEEFIASGGMVTETTAPLVQALRGAGVDITKFTKELQKGTDGNKVAAEFSQDYARGVETNLGNLKTSAALSEDVGKQFGGAVDTLGNINRITGQNQQEVLEQGRKNVASAKEAGKDAAADVAAAIESTERKTQQAIDQFLLQVNPLFKSFEATKAAAIALGVAAAAAAASLVILAKRAGMLSLPGSQPGVPPGTPPGGPSGTGGGLRSVRPGLAAGIGLGGAAVGLAGDYAAEKLGRETTGGKVASTLSAAGTGASIGATVGSIVPGVGTGIGALVGGGLGALYGGYQALTAGKGQEGAAGAAQKTAYQRQLDEANERNRKIQEATIAATKANTEELNKTGKNLQNLSSTVASNTEQAAKEQTTQLLAGQGIGEGIVMSTEQREAAAAAAGG